MRYPASEKLEIIRLLEQSHLGVGSTVDKLGIAKTPFYRCYDRFLAFGDAGLEDRNSSPGRVWNRIPDEVRGQSIDLALEETQLSPRELAVRFTHTRGYFVSQASVYRLLKAHDLITSPAFVVIKAADEFGNKTTAAEPAVAERLHLSQGHRLGLVLPVEHPGGLSPHHHCLEALHQHDGGRCDGNTEVGARSLRLQSRQGPPHAEAAQRQRLVHYRRRCG